MLDEDWHGKDRFDRLPDSRQFAPLPGGVSCYNVAATVATRRSALADRLVGDGLVPLHSALGQHSDMQQNLLFEKSEQWIAYRTNHLQLLHSDEVTRRMLQWLTPVPDEPAPKELTLS